MLKLRSAAEDSKEEAATSWEAASGSERENPAASGWSLRPSEMTNIRSLCRLCNNGWWKVRAVEVL